MTAAVCTRCDARFKPERRTAKFCSPACRAAAFRLRRQDAPGRPQRPVERRERNFDPRYPGGDHDDIRNANSHRAPRTPLPPDTFPMPSGLGMYRLRLADGSLSDMVNLTRAKDARSPGNGLTSWPWLEYQ